jgi:hypothetical protein
LSQNNFAQLGTAQLCNWVGIKGNCVLRNLYLGRTKLDIGAVTRALRNGEVKTLEEIDLSYSRIDAMASQSVAILMESLPRLAYVNLRGCGLQGATAVQILK